MTYQDRWAVCTRCGERFIFRVEEQRRQAERGEEIAPPALCPACRIAAPAERHSGGRGAERRPRPSAVPGAGPYEGTVKWYDGDRGYGFIAQRNGDDIFFHRTGIVPGETPFFSSGTRVTYLVEQTSKGPQAVEVARMDAD